MRWQRLFDDLAAQLEGAAAAELAGEVAERTRIEHGKLRLADRLRAALGGEVVLGCGVDDVRGRLLRVAADAVVVEEIGGAAVVPLPAVASVAGLGRPAAVAVEGPIDRAMGLRMLLRTLARDRSTMRILTSAGGSLDGTIDAVGADWIDLAVHPIGEPRRPGAITAMRTIPIEALAVVRET